jgi:hypothetical protein
MIAEYERVDTASLHNPKDAGILAADYVETVKKLQRTRDPSARQNAGNG